MLCLGRLRNHDPIRPDACALVVRLVDRDDCVLERDAERRMIGVLRLLDLTREHIHGPDFLAIRIMSGRLGAIQAISREVRRFDRVPDQTHAVLFDERRDARRRGRRREVFEPHFCRLRQFALQQRRSRRRDRGDAILVIAVRRRVDVDRSLRRRSVERRRELRRRGVERHAIDEVAADHRRALIPHRLRRLFPRDLHALLIRGRFHVRRRQTHGERNDDGEIRGRAARERAFGDDRVRETHRTSVRGAKRRRVGKEQTRAGGRASEVGLFYAVYFGSELGKLRGGDGRHFRKERNGQRLGRIDVARDNRLRIAAAGHDRKILDVTKHRDAPDVRQALAGGRQRRITPSEEHFVGTLCYNQVGGRLRDDRHRRLRIAALAASAQRDDNQRRQNFSQLLFQLGRILKEQASMCGIIGYVGSRDVVPVLIGGLKKLEYRGYDSAGIAVVNGNGVEVVRAEGKLSNLESKLGEREIHGTFGMGHTRWATHGKPNENNAHPHRDCSGQVVVIHNGIIENFLALKQRLKSQGHEFKSETDTEVVAHLIEEHRKGGVPFVDAVKKTLKELEGHYALVMIAADEPGTIVAAKHGPPLVVGLGEGENIIASDVAPLLAYTRNIIYLEDGEYVVADDKKVELFGESDQKIEREPRRITWDAVTAEKEGYRHYMLKEIHEQPRAVRDTFNGRMFEASGGVVFNDHHLDADEWAKCNCE